MFVRRIILPFALAPCIMAAQAPTAPAAAVEKKRTTNAHDIVCKKFPPPVGTRLGKRKICKTNAEWQMMEQEIFDALDHVQRKPYSTR